MIRFASVAALCIAALTSPALAGDPQDPPVKKEKKICQQPVQTGSILAHSVCHTKQEWDAIKAANQASVDAFQNRARGPAAGSAGN